MMMMINDAMCPYILPLPSDTSAVQQGIFVTCGLCQIQSHTKHSRPRTTLKAKDLNCMAKDFMHQGQGFWPYGPMLRTNITALKNGQ